MLNYTETADGKLTRHWNPPQILPVRAINSYAGRVYGHSNAVPETYKLFDTNSDISSTDDKLPIEAIAKFSYVDYGAQGVLKNFDEYYVEGDISPSTDDLILTLDYDYGGYTQSIQKIIDGTDSGILEETLQNTSLGQQSLGQQPIGGSRFVPEETARFRVIFEIKNAFTLISSLFCRT